MNLTRTASAHGLLRWVFFGPVIGLLAMQGQSARGYRATFPARVIFVDDDAPAGGDGTSWATAYRFLHDALAFAGDPSHGVSQLRVAQGSYQPDRDEANSDGSGEREATFHLINGVALMGGFAGLSQPGNEDERDIDLFETILSGDLLANDGPEFENNDENSFHVVTGSGTDATAVLDGFAITAGNANGSIGPTSRGGGMFTDSGGPTVTGSTFIANIASAGGGLLNVDGSPALIQCTFLANFAEGSGGGISTRGSGGPTLNGCLFIGNRAGSEGIAYGGGISICDSTATLLNCTFSGNVATSLGGGLLLFGPVGTTVVNCTFTQNSTIGPSQGNLSGGGGAIVFGTDALFINCTFTDNSASGGTNGGGGAGVAVVGFPSPVLINCAFVNNWTDFGAAVFNCQSKTELLNCTFTGNSATTNGGGIYNFHGLPAITNCLLAGNTAVLGGAVFSRNSTPALINCTLTDNAAAVGGALYSAFGSAPTVSNCIVWSNSGGEIVDVEEALTTVSYSDVLGGFAGVGNIDADPLFVDPDGPDDDPVTVEDNNYRLAPASPCIDAADNAAVPADGVDLDDDGDTREPIPLDLDGNPRFVDDPDTADTGNGDPPIVDMGAYEFQPCPWDLTGDGEIDRLDLIELLACFGLPANPPCDTGQDVNNDGTVNVLDLIDLLLAFGTACP